MKTNDTDNWQKWVDGNTDPYGRGIITFAERWADSMEAAMAQGEPIAACVSRCCSEADTEGITGFMYGAAVSVLSSSWAHGEDLRRWHNLDTQISSEGERANESGGVLNPALLSVG